MERFINKTWRTTVICWGILLTWVGNGFIIYIDKSWYIQNGLIRALLFILGLILILWGCYIWTKLKDRHWAFMFWGLLAPIGLLGIIFLKNKSYEYTEYKDYPTNFKERKRDKLLISIIVILVIALFSVLGYSLYAYLTS